MLYGPYHTALVVDQIWSISYGLILYDYCHMVHIMWTILYGFILSDSYHIDGILTAKDMP